MRSEHAPEPIFGCLQPADINRDAGVEMTGGDIRFNTPFVNERARLYIGEVLEGRHLAGDGSFTRRCHERLESLLGGHVLLTHSGTAALELAAILSGIGPGDEVILPSFTFSSTANAVVLRGATPVFVDIRPDTLNIDETLVEEAITPATKAIVPVHYAGVCAEMDTINEVAARHGLFVFEDAAQALMSTYKGRPAGTLADAAAFSFHETKNIVSGEGGALWTRSTALSERAEIVREKGTNRRQFLRGAVDKYTWVDVGSSFLPSELIAAFLLSQLDEAEAITRERVGCYEDYRAAFRDDAVRGRVRQPEIPPGCDTNGHMFYLLLDDVRDRDAFIAHMRSNGIVTPFHYVPLHSAPAGRRFGRVHGDLTRTVAQSDRLVRLPLYPGMRGDIPRIVETAGRYLGA